MVTRFHSFENGCEGYADETIAQMLHVGESTVHRTRQKCMDGGVEFALSEQPRPGGNVSWMDVQKRC